MDDGRDILKSKKGLYLPTVWLISTKFGTLTHIYIFNIIHYIGRETVQNKINKQIN